MRSNTDDTLLVPNTFGKGLFHAYRNAALTAASSTTIVFDAEVFDVANWYNATTGFYTPQVKGYYRFNFGLWAAITAGEYFIIQLMQNSTIIMQGDIDTQNTSAVACASFGVFTALANGSTDTFSIQCVSNHAGGAPLYAGPHRCFFQGELILPL